LFQFVHIKIMKYRNLAKCIDFLLNKLVLINNLVFYMVQGHKYDLLNVLRKC
jgi:hypothetical protein